MESTLSPASRTPSTLFAAKDVLTACGIRWGAKWLSSSRKKEENQVPMVKLKYPIMTSYGRREIEMWFMDGSTGDRLIEMVSCPEEVKKWLREDVFPYRFPLAKSVNTVAEMPAVMDNPQIGTRAKMISETNAHDINARIDSILIELVELKSSILKIGT